MKSLKPKKLSKTPWLLNSGAGGIQYVLGFFFNCKFKGPVYTKLKSNQLTPKLDSIHLLLWAQPYLNMGKSSLLSTRDAF